jgi:hypothetical protein
MASKPDALDTLIEDTARQMTAGDPGAAFTSNVVARIDEQGATKAWPTKVGHYAWLAAAAVVLLAVFVWRGDRPTDRGPERPALHAPGLVARPFQGRDQPSADRGPERPVLHAPGLVARPFQGRDQIPSGIDALVVPSIALEQLAPVPLSPMDSLDVDPLTIAPLTVAPIDGADDIQRRFE